MIVVAIQRQTSGESATMDGDHPISSLMFLTLAAGLVAAGGAFACFLRHRHNRYFAGQALTGDGGRHGGAAPNGALPEILGVLAIGVAIVGLLWLGHAAR